MQGPTEVTGKYATRAELVQTISKMNEANIPAKKIAEETCISPSTAHGILKKIREERRLAKVRENKSLLSRAWR